MGTREKTVALFHYFSIEEYVPEGHLLRLIDRHVDLGVVRDKLATYYSDVGRPSIDPEVLFRMLLIGYLYGITSERRLVDEVGMHLAFRWFTGLGFDQSIPHHSTFSKNRHGRFTESTIFRDLFEAVVVQCIEAGLVQGERLSVDGSQIAADANRKSLVKREELHEFATVSRTVREYLAELEAQNDGADSANSAETLGYKVPPKEISVTDPDAGYSKKGGDLPILGYYTNYLVDNESRVILGVEATPARLSQEIVAARKMLNNLEERFGIKPQCLAADTAYGTGEFLAWLIDEKSIEPHIPVKEWHGQNHGAFTRGDFTFQPDDNSFTCPGGKRLPFIGVSNRMRINYYKADPKDCAVCTLKARCTPGRARRIGVHWKKRPEKWREVWSIRNDSVARCANASGSKVYSPS